MKRYFTLRRIVVVTLVLIAPELFALSARGQTTDCLDECLTSYSSCLNSQISGASCDSQFSVCIDACLANYSLMLAYASPSSNSPAHESRQKMQADSNDSGNDFR